MFYVDMPTPEEIGALNLERSDASVSIYLPTTPLTQDAEKSRIALGNLAKKAVSQLEAAGVDKRRVQMIQEQLADLQDDETFWLHQANSLAILVTPESMRTYRMANKLTDIVEVSDRFHLKPLLRAITFPHAAHVLALSENAVRLIEVSADLPAREVSVPNMPTDAATAGGKSGNKDYTGTGHRHGAHGQPSYLTRYVRQIDAALRPVLAGSELPLILATTQSLESLFRSLSVLPTLSSVISGNPEHLSEAELASAARRLLEAYYDEQIQEFKALFDQRTGQQRTTTDVAHAARLATFGGIDRLLIDIDGVIDGTIDKETGIVTFDKKGDAVNYCVVDEITGRALRTGAKVMAVRKADIPGGKDLAVIARYPI